MPAWLAGLDSDPIWAAGALDLPGARKLVPGLPGFLDLNAGWTTEALGSLAARDWLSGEIPWWNPFSGIGLPLAAEMQSSALFLPYILLLAAPCGMVLLLLALQCTAGIGTWRLLRQLALPDQAAVTGALLFELCASFAWLGPPLALPVAFLPWFVLGIEHARAAVLRGETGGWRLIAASIAWSIYAGFPETAYLDGLFALLWAATRCITLPAHRVRLAARMTQGGIVGLLLAAPLLWVFFDLLPGSNVGERSAVVMTHLAIPPAAVSQFLLPYALGLPAGLAAFDVAGTYDWLWGRTGGYVGMGLALAALLGAVAPGPIRLLRWVMAAWVALLLARICGVPGFSSLFRLMPFHADVQIFRYAGASYLLPCCMLAAFAVAAPRMPSRVWPLAVGLLVAGGLTAWMAWPMVVSIRQLMPYLSGSLVYGAVSLLVIALVLASGRPLWASVMLVSDAAILFAAALLPGTLHGVVDRPAIAFLQRHLGLQRFATAGPVQPNYAAAFAIASVNHNYLPAPRLWTDYVAAHVRPDGSAIIFNGTYPPDAPGQPTNLAILRDHLRDDAELGVKYIIVPAGLEPFGPDVARPTAGPRESVRLAAGDALSGQVVAEARPMVAFGVTIGTYFGHSTGMLELELCGAHACVRGSASLAAAADNDMLEIPLERPLLAPGEVTWTLRHPAGADVAVWRLRDADKLVADVKAIYAPAPGVPRRVYHDAAMEIFELPDAAPYFSTLGGPCRVSATSREQADVVCDEPAVLLRRELSMPGWEARLGAADFSPVGSDGIFQAVPVPAGPTTVRFRYRPPGFPAFVSLFVLGVGALIPFRSIRRRWSRAV